MPGHRDHEESRVSAIPGPALYRAGIFGSLALLTGALLIVAFQHRLEYFDDYTTLLNARSMLGGDITEFFWKRFILLPVMLSPFFWLERVFFAEPFGFVASHIFVVCIFAGLLFAFYRLLRLYLRPDTALLGVWLLALNRLVIHYAPFAREAIPATFFTTLAFYFYLRSTRERCLRHDILTAVLIPAAMLSRYNLAVLIFPVICLHQLLGGYVIKDSRCGNRGAAVRALLRKVFFYFLLPVILFFLFFSVVYGSMGLVPFLEGPREALKEMWLFRTLNPVWQEPGQNYFFLAKAFTWPLFLCALLGLAASFFKKWPGSLFHGLWLTVFFLFHTYIVTNKEARYLMPLFPPAYFFAVRGLELIRRGVERWAASVVIRRGVTAGLAMGFFFLPVKNAVSEVARFANPVYHADFAGKVGRTAKAIAGENRVFWIGAYYSLHDKDPVFHPDDEFTYVYDVFNHTMKFYSRKRVIAYEGLPVVPVPEKEMVLIPGVADIAGQGDVVIVNLEPRAYPTRNLPARIQPLYVQRIKTLGFDLVGGSEEEGLVFQAPEQESAGIRIRPEGGLEGVGIPDGLYEFYLDREGMRELTPVTLINVREGAFVMKGSGPLPPDLKGLLLLTYDEVRKFEHP